MTTVDLTYGKEEHSDNEYSAKTKIHPEFKSGFPDYFGSGSLS